MNQKTLCFFMALSTIGWRSDADSEIVPGDAATSQLREIAEGDLANRESFPSFLCRFVVTTGKANTEAEAINAGPTKVTAVAEVLWAVDGDKVAYTRQVRGELAFQGNGDDMTVPIAPTAYLGQGMLALVFDSMLQVGTIHWKESLPPGVRMTPWDMADSLSSDGKVGAGYAIQQYLGKVPNITLKYGGETEVDGRSLLNVVMSYESGRTEFLVDPAKGYLSVQVSVFSAAGKPLLKTHITDAEECSGNRWFPSRCVAIWYPRSPTQGHFVRLLEVTELDAGRRPDESLFEVDVPSPTQIHNGVDPSSAFTLEPGTVHISQLEQILDRTFQRAAERKGRAIAPRSRAYVWWLFVGANVAAVVLLAWLIRIRRIQSKVTRPTDTDN